ASATALDLRAGTTLTLDDLRLGPLRLYSVSGRVVDGATGQPPPRASVWITTTSIMGAEPITASPSYDPATGAFETRVRPGRYRVGVTIPSTPALPSARPPALVAPEANLTVTTTDVSGIVLTLVRR